MPKQKAVCDSSLLINFAKIRRLDLLCKVFEKPLVIPEEVYAEAVEKGIEKREPDAVLIKRSVENKWIAVRRVKKILELPFLGMGERAAISLALESKVQTICVDESPARNAARQLGLNTIGSLGILVLLAKSKLISRQQALHLLDEMIKRDYRISAKILEKFQEALSTK